MRTQIVGAVLLEGFKLVGHFLRSRPINKPSQFSLTAQAAPHKNYYLESETEDAPEPEPVAARQPPVAVSERKELSEVTEERAKSIPTGCVSCAIGHLGTCSGLLNEAMRFAGKDGIDSVEVIDRVGMCLDELNSMERVDLRPEMVVNLSEWEKGLVDQVLLASRETRHKLEALSGVEALEQCAATTQQTRQEVWRDYVKNRAANLTPEDVSAIIPRLLARIDEITAEEEGEVDES